MQARCSHCNAELELVESFEFFDEYECPECGRTIMVAKPETPVEGCPDEYHGYDARCPLCGHYVVWSGDFMRSEVLGDCDDEHDSLAAEVVCPNCGAEITIVDPMEE